MLPSMRATVSSWQPDLILRDPCEYSSAIVAEESSVSVAQVAIGLAEVEWHSINIAAPALEERQRGLTSALRTCNYWTRLPASLDASLFPNTRRYDDAPGTVSSPLPDWWSGSLLPLVYMTFGTVLGHMSMAHEVYRAALEAASRLEARVLLTVGHQFDSSSLGSPPANVHIESWVDQNTVFDQADAVVCHGGSGTTFGALRAGLPVVVVPFFADQRPNGLRVARSGSGMVIDLHRRQRGQSPFERRDAEGVADATRAVLSDPRYRQKARSISRETSRVPTTAELLRTCLDPAQAP